MSLDGYIAGPNGEMDWLFDDQDYGYQEFYAGTDEMVMGRNSFDFVAAYQPYPHADRLNLVFTHRPLPWEAPWLIAKSGDPVEILRARKALPGKAIYLVGGGRLNAALLSAGLIDELILSIHPVVLGGGLPLFDGLSLPATLHTLSVTPYPSGLVQWRMGKVVECRT